MDYRQDNSDDGYSSPYYEEMPCDLVFALDRFLVVVIRLGLRFIVSVIPENTAHCLERISKPVKRAAFAAYGQKTKAEQHYTGNEERIAENP